jgi:hypothetical protein
MSIGLSTDRLKTLRQSNNCQTRWFSLTPATVVVTCTFSLAPDRIDEELLIIERIKRGERMDHLRPSAAARPICKSGKKPADIPASPEAVYAKSGWISWFDWLGSGRIYQHNKSNFKKARAFVRKLGLKSSKEWTKYARSGKRPIDIPAHPQRIYADSGWAGMADWLGTGRVAVPGRQQSEVQTVA